MSVHSSKLKPPKPALLTVQQIIAALPKLTRSDLEAVHAVATNLLGGATAPFVTQGDTLPEAIFNALGATLGRPNQLNFMPDPLVKQLTKQVPAFCQFLDKATPGWDKNKVKQTAFLRFLMGLISADLRRMHIQSTYKTMINSLHRMPEVFDNAFPGYLEAGLGHLIFRQFAVGGADASPSKPLSKRKALVAKAKAQRTKNSDT